jgi:hypothetical protein
MEWQARKAAAWTGKHRQENSIMSMREEVRKLTEEYEKAGRPITAEAFVEEAKDAEKVPHLHKHVWQRPEAELAQIARVQLMHQLMISVRIVTEEGSTTRMLIHTNGTKGYRPAAHVAKSYDLAAAKLRSLTEDIARARQRLSEFRALLSEDVASDIDDKLEAAATVAASALETRAAA